jgi:hypothetical protein
MTGQYGMVPQVRIDRVDDMTVAFTTRSASRSGDADERLLRQFVCPLSEVATQPMPNAPAPVAMQAGAMGPLFLTAAGWQTKSADGYQLYGVGTPIARIKYPDDGAILEFAGDLAVVPSSIVVHGTLAGATGFVDIELLGPDAAEGQHIAWTGAAYIALQLTPHGAKRLHLPAHVQTAEVWPTRIAITASPVSDPSVSGTVDILDSHLAAQAQDIAFARHHEPIRLTLTQNGFAALHTMPGMPDAPDAAPARHATRRV